MRARVHKSKKSSAATVYAHAYLIGSVQANLPRLSISESRGNWQQRRTKERPRKRVPPARRCGCAYVRIKSLNRRCIWQASLPQCVSPGADIRNSNNLFERRSGEATSRPIRISEGATRPAGYREKTKRYPRIQCDATDAWLIPREIIYLPAARARSRKINIAVSLPSVRLPCLLLCLSSLSLLYASPLSRAPCASRRPAKSSLLTGYNSRRCCNGGARGASDGRC